MSLAGCILLSMHRLRLFATSLLSLVLLFPLATAALPTRAADASSDIPGLPMTGQLVSDSVGGGVIDLVYSIQVPGGSMLNVTLSGEAGAELGLYIYAPDALSVTGDEPIASASRPGGTQAIATPIRVAGQYFINVNGRNIDRAYRFSLTVTTQRDTSPPNLTRVSPVSRAQAADACVTVSAIDAISGVSDISVTDATGGVDLAWQRYSGSKRYCTAVEPGDGKRLIKVVARNSIGLMSREVLVQMLIDDTQPQILSTAPKQSGAFQVSRPTFVWNFNEPIRLLDPSGPSVFAMTGSGARFTGRVTYSSDRKRVSWQVPSDLLLGEQISATLRGVVDDAGNTLDPIDTLTAVRKLRTSAKASLISVSAARVALRVQVSGNLIGKSLTVQRRVAGVWEDVQTITAKSGSFSVTVVRGASTAVRIVWGGSERLAPSQSPARSY